MSRRDTKHNNPPHNSYAIDASEIANMPDRVALSTVAQCNTILFSFARSFDAGMPDDQHSRRVSGWNAAGLKSNLNQAGRNNVNVEAMNRCLLEGNDPMT